MEDKKIIYGIGLLLLQVFLLAVTLGFKSACDRQLVSDGISLEQMLRKNATCDSPRLATTAVGMRSSEKATHKAVTRRGTGKNRIRTVAHAAHCAR